MNYEGRAVDRDELLNDGEQLFYDGRFDEALVRFDKAILLDDNDADAYYLKARTLFFLGRDDDSLSAFDRALDVDPEFVAAVVHKAELLLRAFGWPDEALELLDQADELGLSSEDRIDAALVRALAHMERSEFREALEHLNRSVRGDPEWSDARRERGICRFYMWRFEDAARDIEDSLGQDSDDAEAHYFLAMSLERLGRTGESDRHYRTAAELEPQTFLVPLRVPRREFERAAEEALAELPEDFRVRFDNLTLAFGDLPRHEPNILPDLPALFQSKAMPEKPGAIYLEPAQVLLFQKNLERHAPDMEALKDEIGKTVMLEVGQFFGLGEDEIVRLAVH